LKKSLLASIAVCWASLYAFTSRFIYWYDTELVVNLVLRLSKILLHTLRWQNLKHVRSTSLQSHYCCWDQANWWRGFWED
jgi:hypothetical protein